MSIEAYRTDSGSGVPGSRVRLTARPTDVDSWVLVLTATAQLAEQICDTDFVPKEMRGNAAAVTAAILTGRELGIGPMASLAHIHLVKGKPGQSAQLMRQLVLTEGHQIRYPETSDTRCIVEGRRKGETEWERVTFTAEQARKAGIQFNGYPEDKLVARATSRLCRRKFADCLGGMAYTIEELEDGFVESVAIKELDPPAAVTKGSRRTAQRKTTPTLVSASVPVGTVLPRDPAPLGPPLPGEEEDDDTSVSVGRWRDQALSGDASADSLVALYAEVRNAGKLDEMVADEDQQRVTLGDLIKVRGRLARDRETVVDSEIEDPPSVEGQQGDAAPMSEGQKGKLFAILAQGGIKDDDGNRAARLEISKRVLQRPVTTWTTLTWGEASILIDTLEPLVEGNNPLSEVFLDLPPAVKP